MSRSKARQSPNPSEVGFPIDRRQVLTGMGAAAVGGSILAACGSGSDGDSGASGSGDSGASGSSDSGEAMADAASGTMVMGSNYSDENPKAGLQAVADSFPNKDVTVEINAVDHNTFQENISTYLQAPDDLIPWFAGFRMKFFADQGLLGDISDVWGKVSGLGSGFKTASTASDGKQYFMPFSYYTWAVNYSKSLFAENGYEIPNNKAELAALATKMQSDGITPFAFANDGQWPIMGTFDILNMRLNGYDFHVDLMGGKEAWTDDRVKNVFKEWEGLLPFHQEGANGRTWQEAATALENKEAGMYLLGTFVASNYAEENVGDLDFFAFPEMDSAHGRDAVEAPIDGFMMAASPKNEAAAKEMLAHMGSAAGQDAYLTKDPSVVAANDGANTSVYNDLQKKSAELAASSKYISQFLDRDTIPEFASNVMGPLLADFIDDPSKIDALLADAEDQKAAIFN